MRTAHQQSRSHLVAVDLHYLYPCLTYGAGRYVNVIVTAVSGERALVLSTAAGVIGAKGFDDIVLDKGRSGPTIDSKVAVALRVEASTIVDGAMSIVRILRFRQINDSW